MKLTSATPVAGEAMVTAQAATLLAWDAGSLLLSAAVTAFNAPYVKPSNRPAIGAQHYGLPVTHTSCLEAVAAAAAIISRAMQSSRAWRCNELWNLTRELQQRHGRCSTLSFIRSAWQLGSVANPALWLGG